MSDKKPVTMMQEVMLIESRNLASVNLSQWIWRLPVYVDWKMINDGLQQLAKRYDVLSSHFEEIDGRFFQCFNAQASIVVTSEAFSLQEDFDQALESYLVIDRLKGFDFSTASLARCHVLSLLESQSCCVFTFHESMLDSQSFTIFLNELILLLKGGGEGLKSGASQFSDFLQWYESAAPALNHGYWCKLLLDSPESYLPKLPIGSSENAFLSKQAQIDVCFDRGVIEGIRSFASKLRVDIETIFQAAWGILIHRYCDTDDIVFGASGSYRTIDGLNTTGCVGSFINTLPARIRLDREMTLESLLQSLELQRVNRLDAPHASLMDILTHGNSSGVLFSTGINFEHSELIQMLEGHGAPWSNTTVEDVYQTGFDLGCNVRLGKHLIIKLNYSVDKFDLKSAQQIIRHYQNILLSFTSGDQLVFDIDCLDSADVSRLQEASCASTSNKVFVPVHEEIYKNARDYPESIAIVSGDIELSYGSLAQRASELATRMIQLGIGVESIVAIDLPRSIDFVIAVLGVMKAGAAYLPIDPQEPMVRYESMLLDAKVKLILTVKDSKHDASIVSCPVLFLDQMKAVSCLDEFPQCQTHNAAYVIFTSGTTGVPKGVLVEHGNLSNHCVAMGRALSLERNDVSLQFASTVFDVHVEEVFTALCSGARLLIRDEDMAKTASRFFSVIRKHGVTILNLPTAYWTALVEEVSHGKLHWPECIKTLIVGGERVSSLTFSVFQKQKTGNIHFLNGYGPTETTITSTFYSVPLNSASSRLTEKLSRQSLPIGKPISGAIHYVLDRYKRLSVPGVSGELHIGGKGVARGYLNNRDLSVEKFQPLKTITGTDERFYATGDQVFSDGDDFFFVGRADHQIKVRGYRIEIGDIESVIQSCPGVTNSIVVVDPKNAGVLIAFIESQQKQNKLHGRLKQHLSDSLPAHMIPGVFEYFSSFPLTKAGKIDRKALWQQFGDRSSAEYADVEISLTPQQQQLIDIWKSLLGDVPISLKDSFFDLGGHSLLAVKLFSKIERDFNLTVPLREFFHDPTINHLDCLIEKSNSSADALNKQHQTKIGSLYSLQGEGSGCPLYCICGVDLYKDLADSLGDTQPVMGIFLPVEERMLHSFSTKKERFLLPSTQEMASEYVRVIRQNQPFGPYKLAGISFGGILAFEIAQQLKAEGEIVETLVLIDSFVPKKRSLFNFKTLQGQWNRVQIEGASYITWLMRKLKSLYVSWQENKILEKKIRIHDTEDFNLYRHIVYRHSALNYSVEMQTYDDSLILIHAMDGNGEAEGEASYYHGWEKYTRVSRVDIPGDHIGVLKYPNVKLLAESILPSLHQTSYRSALLDTESIATEESSLQLETLLEPAYIASAYMADDGRPLQELRAPQRLRLGVEFELRRCPYSGSRYEKQMNTSALASLSQEIKGIVADTIYLRTEYLKYIGVTSFNLKTFWYFIRVLDSLPAYLVRNRPQLSLEGAIPARISAMFKAAQGLHLAAEVMMLDGRSFDAGVSTDDFMDFIESRGIFMGDEDRACSGPLAMVRAFISSAIDGVGKEGDPEFIHNLLGVKGINGLFKYSDAVSKVFGTKVLFEAYSRNSIHDVFESLGAEQLVADSVPLLSRFGVLRTRDNTVISAVKNHYKSIGEYPNLKASMYTLRDLPRLFKLVSLRNPHIDAELCRQATEYLIENIGQNRQWMSVFRQLQTDVLAILSRTEESPAFSENSFIGLGYMPAVVLGDWLNLKIKYSDEGIVVSAGASLEYFDWTYDEQS